MIIRTGILGATGYTGVELLRLLINHNNVDIKWITSEKFANRKIEDVFPNFKNIFSLKCRSVKDVGYFDEVDLVFSCLPHGSSMHFAKYFQLKETRFIDFSADFRFKDFHIYNKIYKTDHKYPELIKQSVYGLPELFRKDIRNTALVANPGCFATSAMIAVLPLIKHNLIHLESVYIDAKSGLSGGGRAPLPERQYSEANDSINVSTIAGHKQKQEIEEKIINLFKKNINVTFCLYNINISRGILTTITSRLRKKMSKIQLLDAYINYYKNEPFIRIFDNESNISTKNVRYTNYCDIGLNIQDDSIICVTALDNLGKGASGQAVQNMNIMFGLEETESLTSISLFP